ncbi:conserved unknown protein [Ectocarpus siliculosus]|uniref:Mitochondrial inner membrane protease subunit n=1 Tax=Ectocarpus siliculosus TaxID=2880 RepID=D8LTR9_ECTSI|nr:conserved unknown protein [Ectocarpus siliculosus]|eukprot:CBN73966.1 conserved unknown protein [Ectocarpus siliculosus]
MFALRFSRVRPYPGYCRASQQVLRGSISSSSGRLLSVQRDGTRVVGGESANGRQRQHRQQKHQDRGGPHDSGSSSSWGHEGAKFVRQMAWFVCAYQCLREYVVEPCLVHGPSMRPTIEHNSLLLINKMGGRGRTIEAGQIVLVQSPLEIGRLVVKRVTGLPGDSISVRPPEWDVYNSQGIEKRSEVVPEGHVWLAGDNVDNSKDSRNFGSVPQALVLGTVLLRVWPTKDFGFIE